MLLEKHEKFFLELAQGLKTSADLSAMFEEMVANRAQLCAELDMKYTLGKLKTMTTYAPNKRAAVESVADRLIEMYPTVTGLPVSYFLDGNLRESRLKAQRENLAKITQADLDELVEKSRREEREYEEKMAKRQEALANPTTLQDFQRLVILNRGEEHFTEDQLRTYDRLWFEQIERKATTAKVEKVEAVELPASTQLSLKKGWHTKKECDIWLVQLNERVEREKYDELAAKALKFGARWNNFPRHDTSNHGFLFWSEQEAEDFMKLAGGESVTTAGRVERKEQERRLKASDRLLDYAERNMSQAEQELNRGRLVNTWRRMNMANYAEATARESLAFAQTVASVAQVVAEEPDSVLGVVGYATHLQTLCYILNRAWGKAAAAEKGKTYLSAEERRPIEPEDLRFAKYPWPTIKPDLFRKVVVGTKGKKGVADARSNLKGIMTLGSKENYVPLNSLKDIESFNLLLTKIDLAPYEKQMVHESMCHANRLIAMGILNLPSLRHVLRALLPYFAAADKASPLVQAERALIGVDIPGFFPTPMKIVEKMIVLAEMRDDEQYRILEPSAGKGNIADALVALGRSVECVETNYRLRQILTMKAHNLVGDDFLEYTPTEPYDRIFMNPPFEKGQDFEHLRHALTLLRPGGIVVCVVANGATYTKNKEWLREVGCKADVEVEGGAFKESGTSVSTRILAIKKS